MSDKLRPRNESRDCLEDRLQRPRGPRLGGLRLLRKQNRDALLTPGNQFAYDAKEGVISQKLLVNHDAKESVTSCQKPLDNFLIASVPCNAGNSCQNPLANWEVFAC